MTNPAPSRVVVTRSSEALQRKQGLQNIAGVSAEVSGSQGLWLGMIRIPHSRVDRGLRGRVRHGARVCGTRRASSGAGHPPAG